MGTINENVAVLVTQVAELITILLETGATDDMGEAEAMAQGLRRYVKQLEKIMTAAEASGDIGLCNVCMLYQESLVQLACHHDTLSEKQRLLLEEWPTLVMAHLEAPADADVSAVLIEHLQNPAWAAPLSDVDAEMLKELLIAQAAAVSDQEEAVGVAPAAAPSLFVDDTPSERVASDQEPDDVATMRQTSEPEADPFDPAAEDWVQSETLEDIEAFAALETPDVAPMTVEAECEDAVPTQTAYEAISDHLDATDAQDLAEPAPGTLEETAAGELDETAKELLGLLCLEVGQLAESLEAALARTEAEDWRQSLEEHAEELERLGEGAEAMGLIGLQQVSEHIRTNVWSLASQVPSLEPEQRQVVAGWPVPVLGYLQGLYNPDIREALIQYLQDARWPHPLSQAEGATLRAALVVTSFDIGEEEQDPRQRHAQLEDISLAIPEDVNPELLEGLLQELPRQAADFSAAIQHLASDEGTLADVDAAQRVAHTLKGAANTVGVSGLANLTHHLEDILLALAKHQALPTQMLHQTLTNAADCLEAMSETLIGMSELPAEAETLGVLQEVLDWANLIDREGIPREEVRPTTRETLPGLASRTTPAGEDLSQEKTTAAGARTRVSTDLVDELLRLAGEAMILNGQLYDRLEHTQQQLRSMHTQNTTMRQLVLELEQLVDIRGVTSPLLQRHAKAEFDPLEMEQYNELHTVSRRLLETVTDVQEMSQGAQDGLLELNDLLTNQRRVQQENESTIMRTRMVPIKTIAPRLQRGVRQACRLTGKEAALVISGTETLMDSNVLTSMIDPLMHLLRNAVDHGIERPAERELIGKSRVGAIALDFVREGNTIVARCRDDGAGLEYAAIRHTAMERGLIRENQVLSEEELGRLILQPGFSTRSQATQVSGRGIGMDAVYNQVQALKGSLHITSEANKGCWIELRLPVTLMSTHGLLVRTGKEVFAVSDRGVEQLLYPGAGELGQIGNKMIYQVGEEIFEATFLRELLNQGLDQRQELQARYPALLVREESGRNRVVFVQEIIDSLTLVVKNLSRFIPDIKGIIGATILGDGSVTPVLDLPDLLRSPARTYTGPVAPEAVTPAESHAPMALVVDDSLSARRALAEFVRDLGFEVRTASDGLEAIALLDHQVPDILLVDLEMPRMNGLELTSHVRSRDTMKHLPVIMITSRSTEKHRHSAAQAGVDAYLIKPFAEDELMAHIQQLTTLRGVA